MADWIPVGTRRLGLAAAFFGAALFLGTPGLLPPAAAGTERAELAPGPGGTGSEAQGRIRFKARPRGERLKIRLDHLLPRADYEIRDGATGEVLGTIRTDRRGRSRKTLRARGGPTFAGISLEICRPGSDDPVLQGTVPGDAGWSPWYGGAYAIGTVSTDPGARVQVSITLSKTTLAFPDGETDRNGTYDSISLFAGPGGVWAMEAGDDRGIPDLTSIPGPVTFWIADGERGLVQVASIDRDEYGLPIPLGDPGAGRNGVAGRTHHPRRHRGHQGIQRGAASRGILPGEPPPGGWNDGTIFPFPDTYSWYADNMNDEGLPLGAGTVADLSGLAFEVRDGEGTVLLDGVLPELEEVRFEPGPDPLPCTGIGFTIDFGIQFDFSGVDWNAFDWGSFDWSSLDPGALPGGDGSCFDFSKFLREFRY